MSEPPTPARPARRGGLYGGGGGGIPTTFSHHEHFDENTSSTQVLEDRVEPIHHQSNHHLQHLHAHAREASLSSQRARPHTAHEFYGHLPSPSPSPSVVNGGAYPPTSAAYASPNGRLSGFAYSSAPTNSNSMLQQEQRHGFAGNPYPHGLTLPSSRPHTAAALTGGNSFNPPKRSFASASSANISASRTNNSGAYASPTSSTSASRAGNRLFGSESADGAATGSECDTSFVKHAATNQPSVRIAGHFANVSIANTRLGSVAASSSTDSFVINRGDSSPVMANGRREPRPVATALSYNSVSSSSVSAETTNTIVVGNAPPLRGPSYSSSQQALLSRQETTDNVTVFSGNEDLFGEGEENGGSLSTRVSGAGIGGALRGSSTSTGSYFTSNGRPNGNKAQDNEIIDDSNTYESSPRFTTSRACSQQRMQQQLNSSSSPVATTATTTSSLSASAGRGNSNSLPRSGTSRERSVDGGKHPRGYSAELASNFGALGLRSCSRSNGGYGSPQDSSFLTQQSQIHPYSSPNARPLDDQASLHHQQRTPTKKKQPNNYAPSQDEDEEEVDADERGHGRQGKEKEGVVLGRGMPPLPTALRRLGAIRGTVGGEQTNINCRRTNHFDENDQEAMDKFENEYDTMSHGAPALRREASPSIRRNFGNSQNQNDYHNNNNNNNFLNARNNTANNSGGVVNNNNGGSRAGASTDSAFLNRASQASSFHITTNLLDHGGRGGDGRGGPAFGHGLAGGSSSVSMGRSHSNFLVTCDSLSRARLLGAHSISETQLEPDPPTVFRPSRLLKDFREVRELGQGHFGRVVLVQENYTGQFFAVKISSEAMSYREELRLKHERNIMNALRGSPHCVYLHDAWMEKVSVYNPRESKDEEKNKMHLQMPWYECGNVATIATARRKKKVAWSEKEIIVFLAHMAMALDSMHTVNIVHVDVKPDNILIDASGSYYLGDFGLALTLDDETQRPLSLSHNYLATSSQECLTPQTTIAPFRSNGNMHPLSQLCGPDGYHSVTQSVASQDEGDCRYLAQDMLNQKEHYKAGDIFSLGMSCYELMRGEALPARGDECQRLRSRTDLNELLRPSDGSKPLCPPAMYSRELVELILSMINADPMQRPTARQIIYAPLLRPTADSVGVLANAAEIMANNIPAVLPAACAHSFLEESDVLNDDGFSSDFFSSGGGAPSVVSRGFSCGQLHHLASPSVDNPYSQQDHASPHNPHDSTVCMPNSLENARAQSEGHGGATTTPLVKHPSTTKFWETTPRQQQHDDDPSSSVPAGNNDDRTPQTTAGRRGGQYRPMTNNTQHHFDPELSRNPTNVFCSPTPMLCNPNERTLPAIGGETPARFFEGGKAVDHSNDRAATNLRAGDSEGMGGRAKTGLSDSSACSFASGESGIIGQPDALTPEAVALRKCVSGTLLSEIRYHRALLEVAQYIFDIVNKAMCGVVPAARARYIQWQLLRNKRSSGADRAVSSGRNTAFDRQCNPHHRLLDSDSFNVHASTAPLLTCDASTPSTRTARNFIPEPLRGVSKPPPMGGGIMKSGIPLTSINSNSMQQHTPSTNLLSMHREGAYSEKKSAFVNENSSSSGAGITPPTSTQSNSNESIPHRNSHREGPRSKPLNNLSSHQLHSYFVENSIMAAAEASTPLLQPSDTVSAFTVGYETPSNRSRR